MNTVPSTPQILGSGKEIAQYLGKGVRTVQRWALVHGLPVRRPNGAPHGVVYASREELEGWLLTKWCPRNGGNRNSNNSYTGIPTSEVVNCSQNLRAANRELMASLAQTIDNLKRQCAEMAATRAVAQRIRAGVTFHRGAA